MDRVRIERLGEELAREADPMHQMAIGQEAHEYGKGRGFSEEEVNQILHEQVLKHLETVKELERMLRIISS